MARVFSSEPSCQDQTRKPTRQLYSGKGEIMVRYVNLINMIDQVMEIILGDLTPNCHTVNMINLRRCSDCTVTPSSPLLKANRYQDSQSGNDKPRFCGGEEHSWRRTFRGTTQLRPPHPTLGACQPIGDLPWSPPLVAWALSCLLVLSCKVPNLAQEPKWTHCQPTV